MSVYFDPDIKTIFAPYVQPMLAVSIATDEGTFSLDLSNYESVCQLSQRIKIAIEGYRPETPTAHRMPPGGPLPDESIAMYNEWLEAGMPEKKDALASDDLIV
ncbi:hypothetical protein SAMN04488028_10751 [Reichenbachiella agariperforans]|uniref:Uncharacterized protein n=1 Tax=Reichenbachiella agariperforans TaxID=156994 RepID=A0A1M6UC69_REIAG|nr:hypothetical protein [Reichenbachiella agariperforans]SHK66648.1 hypothetical protein SAMN04488028_10751 [Reichenbachiella agariperforans]